MRWLAMAIAVGNLTRRSGPHAKARAIEIVGIWIVSGFQDGKEGLVGCAAAAAYVGAMRTPDRPMQKCIPGAPTKVTK